MMNADHRPNARPPLRDERDFGRSVGGVCLALAAWSLWRGRMRAAAVLGSIGGVLLLGGLFAPAALRLPNRLWRGFAHALGWVNSRILLSFVFFVVVTPVGLFRRAFADAMRRRHAPGQSGWTPYPARLADAHHYKRMY